MKQNELMRYKKKVGLNFAQQRLASGLTIEQLSRESGVSVKKISAVELGRTHLYLEMLCQVAKHLKCKVDDFFRG